MPKGSTIPKGRVSLPREPKPKPKDKVLVFADGKAAEEAKRAGADIVGGAELVEGVCELFRTVCLEIDFGLAPGSEW
jgi:large subunit ribosomal protein L1